MLAAIKMKVLSSIIILFFAVHSIAFSISHHSKIHIKHLTHLKGEKLSSFISKLNLIEGSGKALHLNPNNLRPDTGYGYEIYFDTINKELTFLFCKSINKPIESNSPTIVDALLISGLTNQEILDSKSCLCESDIWGILFRDSNNEMQLYRAVGFNFKSDKIVLANKHKVKCGKFIPPP